MALSDSSVQKTEVGTGDGNDTVEVNVGAANGHSVGEVSVTTGDGDDSVTVINRDKASVDSSLRQGSVTVDLGTGVNEATVSTDVAGVVPTVTINGEDGNNHVHITGTLNEDKGEDERISGTADNLTLEGDKGALNLILDQIASLTDDLVNKKNRDAGRCGREDGILCL